MPYNLERVMPMLVNKATQAIGVIIPHPGAGKRIAIDYIHLNPSGGNNVVTLTGTIAVPYGLNDNQDITLVNSIHAPEGIFPMNADQAFSITLGSATQVEGYILYRIING